MRPATGIVVQKAGAALLHVDPIARRDNGVPVRHFDVDCSNVDAPPAG